MFGQSFLMSSLFFRFDSFLLAPVRSIGCKRLRVCVVNEQHSTECVMLISIRHYVQSFWRVTNCGRICCRWEQTERWCFVLNQCHATLTIILIKLFQTLAHLVGRAGWVPTPKWTVAFIIRSASHDLPINFIELSTMRVETKHLLRVRPIFRCADEPGNGGNYKLRVN